jgi:hypothetical protein
VEEYSNNKINLLCCFVDFRKAFDTMPKMNLWNRLKNIRVSFELRVVAVTLNENIIAKCRRTLLPSLGAVGVGQKKLTII